jgi:hypothetical protein
MDTEVDLGENAGFSLDALLSGDGKYSGIVVGGTAGATLAFGDLCYLDPTDSRWELADANVVTSADGDSRGILGLCALAAAANGNATKMLLWGKMRSATFPAFTINELLYVSETAGDITHTMPTTAAVNQRAIGVALTAEDVFFNSSWMPYLDATTPAIVGTAAAGTSIFAAHRDHVHGDVAANATHIGASAAVHGLPASVNVLGCRTAAGKFVQYGTKSASAAAGALAVTYYHAIATTYPVAFGAAPIVLISDDVQGLPTGVDSVTTTGFNGNVYDATNGSVTRNFVYIAIGA